MSKKVKFSKQVVLEAAGHVYQKLSVSTTVSDIICRVRDITRLDYFDIQKKVRTILTKNGWIG